MNFISECTLRSRKLNDGEERREYVALSEVKRLFEQYRIYLMQEMEKDKIPEGEGFPGQYIHDSAIELCQDIVKESNK